jgi:hypothetical protein
MKEQLEAFARDAGRSVNAEIVHRLGISLHMKRAEEVFTKAATFGVLEMLQDPLVHDEAMALWSEMRKKLPLQSLESAAERVMAAVLGTREQAHPWEERKPRRPAKKG